MSKIILFFMSYFVFKQIISYDNFNKLSELDLFYYSFACWVKWQQGKSNIMISTCDIYE